MLEETLSNGLISAVERFISRLNEREAQIPLAVWMRQDDTEGPDAWRLVLVMPVTEAGGRLKCYEKVVSAYNSHRKEFFPLRAFDIEVEPLYSGRLKTFGELAKAWRISYLTPDYSSELGDGLFSGDSFVYIPKGTAKLTSVAF